MRQKKILILYASLGVGHKTAAMAIAEAFAYKYPDIKVKSVDVLDFLFDIFKHGLPWVYYRTTSKTPTLYRWIYKYYRKQSRHGFLNNFSGSMLKRSRFVKLIRDFDPDFIISTNPFSMQLVSKTKEKKIISIPSANVCTDFGFHSFWINADTNYYFAANNDVKRSLIENGVESRKIEVMGIPTSLKFNKVSSRKKIIKDLGFNSSKPTLLVVGGKISYRSLSKIIKGVKKKNNKAQFIVVSGRDEELYSKLKNSEVSKNPDVRIFGFIDNLQDYMAVSDLALTKPGGLTVSECLIKNLPMVFDRVIPGQEEDNSSYASKHGVGIKVNGVKRSIDAINQLFSNSKKLAKMKKNCKKVARPRAAIDLADFIVSKI